MSDRNPSPKKEFLANETLIKNHHALLDNPSLQIAIETTMAEISRRACNQTMPTEFNACAAAHLRMLGAHDFVNEFLNLAESLPTAPAKHSDNLPGNLPTRKN